MSWFSNFDRIVQNIENPNRKIIGKYKNCPRIATNQTKCLWRQEQVSFTESITEDIEKEILVLKTKIFHISRNIDVFSEII